MDRASLVRSRSLPVLGPGSPHDFEPSLLATAGAEVLRGVLLVSLDWTRPKDPRLSLGHASLLAALHAAKRVAVEGVTAAVNEPGFRIQGFTEEILRRCRALAVSQCDIAVGAYVWNEPYLPALLRGLRLGRFRGRIILGGPQISYSGPGLEQLYPEADCFIRGYAEATLCAVAATEAKLALPGVHWAGEPDAALPSRVDLRAIPSPFLSGLVPVAGQRFLRWETQRGCPYRCSFCQHREPGSRLHRRGLESDRLRQEIALFAQSGVESIAVLDPIFNIGAHALAVLAEFRQRRFTGRLSLQCRFELVSPEFLAACQELNVCLEFGLQTIHESEGRAIERPNDLAKVTAVIGELRRLAIPFEVSLIYGLPTQTLASFRASVEFCLRMGVPTIRAFPLMLLRGTALDRDRARWRLVESADPIPCVIASDSFTQADWLEMAALAQALERSEGAHPTGLTQRTRGLQVAVAGSGQLSPAWPPSSLAPPVP